MTWKSEPAPQFVIEKDDWKVTIVSYPADEAKDAALALIYGE
jgi:hypothetical protein